MCPARGISGQRDCPARRGGGFGDWMQPAGTCRDISERTDKGSFCRCAAAGGEKWKWSEHGRVKALSQQKKKKINHIDSQVLELAKKTLEVLEM